jgi:transmembrane sensor
MSDNVPAAAEAQATDWLIRQRDPDFDEWEAFTAWLEVSPDHAAIYDRLASMDADLDDLPNPVEESDALSEPVIVNRRKWLGGAIAAALIGVISLTLLNNGTTRIETDAGEHRTIALEDGSRIEINGATIIELEEDRPRYARLETGEAMFHIVHREDEPFLVLYNPERENVRLKAGFGIEVSDGDGHPQAQSIDPLTIGGWRNGQLVYNGASIGQVAEDLNRTAGLTISVSPDVAALPFRGALLVGEDKQRVIDDLTALAGIRAEKQTEGWLLTR